MGLFNFFRINLPYGISRNDAGQWIAFNREYLPIGWNTTTGNESIIAKEYNEIPVYTTYPGLTEKFLISIAVDEKSIHRNEKGEIVQVFLYNDRTNPTTDSNHWDSYFNRIKKLGSVERKDLVR
jgi:hypothetical protein